MSDHRIAGHPSISPAQFRKVLADYRSPALPISDECYMTCTHWGLDAAVALAFFLHESSAGTQGAARKTLNWGNLRSGPGQMDNDGQFAYYASWVVGLNDWCKLLRGSLYEGADLKTVSQVIPRYAPRSENDVAAYVSAVNGMVDQWMVPTKGGNTP